MLEGRAGDEDENTADKTALISRIYQEYIRTVVFDEFSTRTEALRMGLAVMDEYAPSI